MLEGDEGLFCSLLDIAPCSVAELTKALITLPSAVPLHAVQYRTVAEEQTVQEFVYSLSKA